jgi:hypothetical protein
LLRDAVSQQIPVLTKKQQDEIRNNIQLLDDDEFEKREKATAYLNKNYQLARDEIHGALKTQLSKEQERRIKSIIADAKDRNTVRLFPHSVTGDEAPFIDPGDYQESAALIVLAYRFRSNAELREVIGKGSRISEAAVPAVGIGALYPRPHVLERENVDKVLFKLGFRTTRGTWKP